MITRLIGYTLIAAAPIVAVGAVYGGSDKSTVPLVFSPVQLVAATWLEYKQDYLEEGTYRTLDIGRNNITTSEGQGYTMLRAVWFGEQETFDGAWRWTQSYLQHSNNNLFAWKWGKHANGTYGILTSEGGHNSASDADTNIALALIFAYARWQDPAYLTHARAIVNDIWEREVIEVRGRHYLAANDLEKDSKSSVAIINPSYFNPAAYRVFAKIDKTHPWDTLADDSLDLLEASMKAPLNTKTSAGIPPDWLQIDKESGALSAASAPSYNTHYGFDAMRIPFALALDYEWFGDPRDEKVLAQFTKLGDEWRAHSALPSVLAHDGSVLDATERPSMYGGSIGYFMRTDPETAKHVYEKKLIYLYNPGANDWKQDLSYYDDNWTWFGVSLYNHLLPNLAAPLPASAFMQ